MSEENQFEKSLKLMKICLLLSGINVYETQWHPTLDIVLNTALYYFNIVILYSVIFAEIYWVVNGILIGKDFVEMSLTAPCITISILSTLKTVPLYFKRDIIIHIINTLKEIYPQEADIDGNSINNNISAGGVYFHGHEKHKPNPKQKLNTKEDYKSLKNKDHTGTKESLNLEENQKTGEQLAEEAAKLLKVAGFLLSGISVAVLVTFLLAPLVLIYWNYYQTGEMKIKYPFAVKYWFDAYEVKFWPLVYFQQVWATVIVCLNIFGTETLFYSLCTYIEMHFRILCHQLEGIQPGLRTQHALMAGVKRHQLLIYLIEKTEELFSRPVLFHFVSSSFLICLSAFNITFATEVGSVFAFVTFLLLSLSQVSLLCYFGDKLMRSSTEVSGAIYMSPWYDFNKNEKKAVFIIIIRAQKACKLTASKFADLNLRAFTTILSRSWSYFTLLRTIYN